jgi:hypothetical protein
VDLRRVTPSDWGAGFFGAALIGLLWAPWYRAYEPAFVSRTPAPPHPSFNAWQAMAVNDVILLIAGALGIWVVVATATQSTGAVPITANVFASLMGLIASVLAVIRLIWPPDLGPGPTDRAVGVWLGAAAAILMTLAALKSMSSERRAETADVPATTLPAPQA